jgi:hypothetical protein
MAESNVKINLRAEDKATPTIRKVNEVFKQYKASYETIAQFQQRLKDEAQAAARAQDDLGKSTKEAGNAADDAGGKFDGLFKTFTLASLAAQAVTRGFQFLKQQLSESLGAAAAMESAQRGLSNTTLKLGHDMERANAAINMVTSDGLVSYISASKTLQNLMNAGLGIDEATMLMQRFKDEAAFGRKETISFANAFEGLGEAWLTKSSMMGNMRGHATNFSQDMEIGARAIGKQTAAMTEAEKTAATFIGYMQQSGHTIGNAGEYAETYAGQLTKMEVQAMSAQATLGQALQPAISMVTGSFGAFLGSLAASPDTMKTVQSYLVTLAAVVQTVAHVFISAAKIIYGAIQSLFTLSWQPLIDAIDSSANRFVDTWKNAYSKYEDIYTDSTEKSVDVHSRAQEGMTDAQKKALAKQQQQLEDADRQFARSMEQRTKQFEEALQDMIIAHRDKTRSLEQDLKAEDDAYAQQTAKRKKQLQEDLVKLEDRHKEKVGDITKKISEEKARGIVVDGVLYANANQEKIKELEDTLKKEQTEYQKAVEDRRTKHAEELADDKTRHTKRREQLAASLSEERAILSRHATDVKAVGDKQKEDDISRLKRKFAEETVLANQNHVEQIARIKRQAAEQGTTAGGGFAQGISDVIAQQSGNLSQAFAKVGEDMGRGMREGFEKEVNKKDGDGFSLSDWWKGTNLGPSLAAGVKTILPTLGPLGALYRLGQTAGLIPHAEGGWITRPTLLTDMATGRPYGTMSERGPEAIVPPHKMQQGAGNGMTIHIGTQVLQSNLSAQSFFRTAYWEMRR